MRRVLLASLLSAALPAMAAAATVTYPTNCTPAGVCVMAQPVVNPDGTNVGSGSGGGTPSGTAGSPNAAVVTVQGINGGTPQNVQTIDGYTAPATMASTTGTAYTVTLGKGQGTVAFAITGLTASGATLTSQYSDDNGANFYPLRNIGTATVPGSITFTTDGPISFTAAGHTQLRLIVTTPGTGNITIGSNASVPARGVNLEGAGTAATNPLYATITSATETTIANNQTNGQQQIQGNAASGAADSGNPVKMGCRYNATAIALTDGQRGDVQCTATGGMRVTLGSNTNPVAAAVPADGAVPTTGLSVNTQSYLYSGTAYALARGTTDGAAVFQASTASPLGGTPTTAVLSTGSLVLKASAGNLQSLNVVNSTVAGFVLVLNAASAPTSGTAVTAATYGYCMPIAASVGFDKSFPMPLTLSNGGVVTVSTSCTAFTPVSTAPIVLAGQMK